MRSGMRIETRWTMGMHGERVLAGRQRAAFIGYIHTCIFEYGFMVCIGWRWAALGTLLSETGYTLGSFLTGGIGLCGSTSRELFIETLPILNGRCAHDVCVPWNVR
jgi:hypothetical protein